MDNQEFAKACIKELESEYASTRKCIERVPESLYEFKPHPKSMALGYLTLLVAEIPLWLKYTIEEGVIDFQTYQRVNPETTEKMVDHFESSFALARQALENVKGTELEEMFHLKNGEQVLMAMSKRDSVRQSINHWVHHRGQLTVYMRLNDIAVPSIYGPSADDRQF